MAKDTAGRALAATLLGETGLAVRVVVVYAPVGACSPGFAHSSLAPAEADLKLFVDAQISLCAANSMALIIGGDLNSFISVDLDSWKGTYVDSPTCLAAHLRNQDLLDTFRERRPNLKAYTYYSHSGSASRLDAIWWFPSADQETQVLNAATLSVVADFDIRLPQLPTPKPELPLHWRQLVRRISLDLPSLVSGNLEPHQSALQHLSQELDAAGAAWQALPEPPCEGLDGVFGTVATRLLHTVHQIHDKLMQILLACLPPPVPTASRQQARVSSGWQACLLELRRVKRAVQDDAFLFRGGFRPSSISITTVAEAWCKATGMTAHQQERTECPALPAWDFFLSNPSEWARGLGLPGVASHLARAAVDVHPAVAEPVQPALLTWDVLLARGATHSHCIAVLEELIAFAAAKHTSLSRLHMRDSDVLTGARQECSRLLHEPPRPWSRDLVLTFNSPLLQQRGAIDKVRLAQTSRLASVGKASMEPGPWQLCRVQPHSLSHLRLVIGPRVLPPARPLPALQVPSGRAIRAMQCHRQRCARRVAASSRSGNPP